MFISILGRQPQLSIAELEAVYGVSSVTQVAADVATIATEAMDLSTLGGSTKVGRVVHRSALSQGSDKDALLAASKLIIQEYTKEWRTIEHKITLGISVYGLQVAPRDVQKTGLLLKSALKKHGVSLRLIPNTEPALSTAVSHNNKLGLSHNKVELLVVKTKDSILIAESHGSQNITAYARRDHGKPKRDAFVGMLPPKLAQIMLNLAVGNVTTQGENAKPSLYILDPFCGTGTVLQEALLRGSDVLGSDLSDKMVDYTQQNLAWVTSNYKYTGSVTAITQADAMKHTWPEAQLLDAVVCETYLGQPFSAPPSPPKLKEVVGNCNHIISEFLKNIQPQLRPDTPLCIAVPSWRSKDGYFTHLPLVRKLSELGYELQREPLIYARPDQVVARELLVLKTTL